VGEQKSLGSKEPICRPASVATSASVGRRITINQLKKENNSDYTPTVLLVERTKAIIVEGELENVALRRNGGGDVECKRRIVWPRLSLLTLKLMHTLYPVALLAEDDDWASLVGLRQFIGCKTIPISQLGIAWIILADSLQNASALFIK